MGQLVSVLCYGLAGVGGFAIGRSRRRPAHPVLTPVGSSLFALALCAAAEFHLSRHQTTSGPVSGDMLYVQQWLTPYRVSDKKVDATGAAYFEVREGLRLRGYVFRSEAFMGTVYGYGGPMALIAFVGADGMLIDYRITRSYETPRYIRWLGSWMESLKGRAVFGSRPMEGVHAVSGATLSSRAILRLLCGSGEQFAATVLGEGGPVVGARRFTAESLDWPLMYSLTAVVLALAAVYHGRLWGRLAVLVYTVLVGGLQLNRQYSTDHVLRLLSGQDLLGGSPAGLWLLLGIPIVVLLAGNIYCGYLCPFGAIQELAGFIVPARFKARLSLGTIRGARFVKYGLLFVFVAVFLATGSKHVLEADPLALFFNMRFWREPLAASPGLITGVVALLGSLMVTRIWCRYLCPAGAFLSLLNHVAWLRRWLPARRIGRCEFALTGRDQLDCLYCDRCRYDSALLPKREDVVGRTVNAPPTIVFVVAILYLAVFILVPVVERALKP